MSDSWLKPNDSACVLDHVDEILKHFEVCSNGHVPGLIEAVELVLCLVEGMWELLLALEVESDLFNGLEEPDAVSTFGDRSVVVVSRLDLLSHDIGALAPNEGIQGFEVLVELILSSNELLDLLLPADGLLSVI